MSYLDEVLPIDLKPQGVLSFDVVENIRPLTKKYFGLVTVDITYLSEKSYPLPLEFMSCQSNANFRPTMKKHVTMFKFEVLESSGNKVYSATMNDCNNINTFTFSIDNLQHDYCVIVTPYYKNIINKNDNMYAFGTLDISEDNVIHEGERVHKIFYTKQILSERNVSNKYHYPEDKKERCSTPIKDIINHSENEYSRSANLVLPEQPRYSIIKKNISPASNKNNDVPFSYMDYNNSIMSFNNLFGYGFDYDLQAEVDSTNNSTNKYTSNVYIDYDENSELDNVHIDVLTDSDKNDGELTKQIDKKETSDTVEKDCERECNYDHKKDKKSLEDGNFFYEPWFTKLSGYDAPIVRDYYIDDLYEIKLYNQAVRQSQNNTNNTNNTNNRQHSNKEDITKSLIDEFIYQSF